MTVVPNFDYYVIKQHTLEKTVDRLSFISGMNSGYFTYDDTVFVQNGWKEIPGYTMTYYSAPGDGNQGYGAYLYEFTGNFQKGKVITFESGVITGTTPPQSTNYGGSAVFY